MRKVSSTTAETPFIADVNSGKASAEADFNAVDLVAFIISCALDLLLIFSHEERRKANITTRLNKIVILFIITDLVNVKLFF
jgi:hypothetical protein